MTQELLDGVQMRAGLQEVGGKGMPQRFPTLLTSSPRRRSTTGTIRFTALKLKWCAPSAESERRFWSSKFLRVFRSLFRAGCSMRSIAANCRKRSGPAWPWQHCLS